jgi:phosphoserine phosphatase RsbU/P
MSDVPADSGRRRHEAGSEAATRLPEGSARRANGVLLAVLAGLFVLDTVTGEQVVLVGVFGLVPLAAAALKPPRATAALALLAVLAAATSGLLNDRLGSVDHAVRMTIVALVGVGALARAALRCRRERELDVMTEVALVAQRALLRALPATVGKVGIAASYQSAAQDALIGGDLYDVVVGQHGLRVLIGDVRGKGLEAVHLASTVLGAFRAVAHEEEQLQEVARRLDEAVSREAGEEDFVTALIVEVRDDGTLCLVNCGHHPPALISGSGLHFLTNNELSPPLGLHAEPREEVHRWQPTDRLLLYTDGLVEARDLAGGFFLLEQQVDCLFRGTLEDCLDELLQAVTRHAHGGLRDDLALVLLANLASLPEELPAPRHEMLTAPKPGRAPRRARSARRSPWRRDGSDPSTSHRRSARRRRAAPRTGPPRSP